MLSAVSQPVHEASDFTKSFPLGLMGLQSKLPRQIPAMQQGTFSGGERQYAILIMLWWWCWWWYWLCYGDCDGDCNFYHTRYYRTHHYYYYLQVLIQCPLGQGAESNRHLVRWDHFIVDLFISQHLYHHYLLMLS